MSCWPTIFPSSLSCKSLYLPRKYRLAATRSICRSCILPSLETLISQAVPNKIRLERPLDFDSVDRVPVDLIFALFAPKDSGVEHLKALAAVSRMLRDETTRAKLRKNNDPAALHAAKPWRSAPGADLRALSLSRRHPRGPPPAR